MKRLHLFELEDQSWFPSFLRNFGTDFLQFLSNKSGMFQPAVPLIEKGLDAGKENRIIDLASGGGGGLLGISETLVNKRKDLQITLTDFYPNKPAFEYAKDRYPNVDYLSDPVDAKAVPPDLKGLRTMFLSLHHFKPEEAVSILQSAVDSDNPIAVFEGQERSVPSFLAMFFSPVTVLLTTPFIRPFKLGRILFTYLIPVIPLFVWWDGMVSALRTYSVKEMNDLIEMVENKDEYHWETGRVKSGPGIVLYLLGTKKPDGTQ